MNSVENKLKNNFKALRNTLDMTQVKIGESLGVTDSYISAIERGEAINPSPQFFNSVELKYGIKQKTLVEGNAEEIKNALKEKTNYPDISENGPGTANPKTDFGKHGGWTPQSRESDWGFINQLANIINSNSKYTEALLLTIETYDKALREGETNRRKVKRRKQDAEYKGVDRRRVERRQKTALGE